LSVGLRGDSGPFDAADRVQQFGCARRRAAEAYHGEQRKLYDNLKLASVLDAPLKRLGHLRSKPIERKWIGPSALALGKNRPVALGWIDHCQEQDWEPTEKRKRVQVIIGLCEGMRRWGTSEGINSATPE